MTTSAPMLTARFWRSRRSAARGDRIPCVLLLVALTMIRIALSEDTLQSLQTDAQRRGLVRLSLHLVPFAGIAFHRGSSVSSAISSAASRIACSPPSSWAAGCSSWRCCSSERSSPPGCSRCSPDRASTPTFSRTAATSTQTLISVYAMRMAAVFTISVSICRAANLGLAALGLLRRLSRRADPAGGGRGAEMDPTLVSRLGAPGLRRHSHHASAQP